MKPVGLLLTYRSQGKELAIVSIQDDSLIREVAHKAIIEAEDKVSQWRGDPIVLSTLKENRDHLKRILGILIPSLLEKKSKESPSLLTGGEKGASHGG